MKRLQPYLPALAIFCLALLVRVVYNLTVARNYVAGYDSQAYERIALHLLQEHCFCLDPHLSTAGRAPVWPGVIAIIYALLGPKNFFVRLFLCFIGSGTCVLIYLLAKDIFGKRIALVAGIIAALYPGLFIYDGWLYSESLYTFLLTAFFYTLYRVQSTSKRRWMIVSGVVLGLLSLTRPNGLIIIGLVFLWAIIVAWGKVISWRAACESIVLISLLALAITFPWTARNYIISHHQFIPVATGDGIVLLGAYNHMILDNSTPFKGIWIRPSLSSPQLSRKFGGCAAACEVQRDTAFKQQAAQWVQSHINDMPYLLSLHMLKMWTPATPEADLPMNQFPDRISSRVVAGMVEYMSIPVFILAAFGLLVTWRKWRHLMFFYLILLLTIGECLYFYGSSRFRAPIEPILVLLGAGAMWWITQRFDDRSKASRERRGASKEPEHSSTAQGITNEERALASDTVD